MRICFCGDRNWANQHIIKQVLVAIDPNYASIVHGNARGADIIAGTLAMEMEYMVEVYPADWKQYGKVAGPIRNQQMLDSGLDLVFAFHNNLSESKGTKNMVEISRKAGVPVGVFSE